MNLIKAIEKPFNGTDIVFYRNAEKLPQPQEEVLWTTAEQLGEALGYENPRKSVNNLFNRNKNFLTPYTCVVKLGTQGHQGGIKLIPPRGGKQETRFFNETGAHIVAVKANTPKAEEYILWLDDLAREYRRGVLLRLNSKVIPQMNYSPFLPNAQQIRELRLTGGSERAWEYLVKIMDSTLARNYIDKSKTPSQRLRQAMSRQGMSQGRLSELTSISCTSLSKYWTTDALPRRSFQEKIASALGMTPEEIWGDGVPNTGRDN